MNDVDKTARELFALTAGIAARLMGKGSTTPSSAAVQARNTVAALLDVEGISFDLVLDSISGKAMAIEFLFEPTPQEQATFRASLSPDGRQL